MLQFFVNGGVPMVFVGVLGGVGLASAGRFMRSPDRRRVPAVVALSVAVGFAALTGVVTDVLVFTRRVAEEPSFHDALGPIVLQGISESLSPAVLGGAFLCVTWMVMAVGFRRLAVISP